MKMNASVKERKYLVGFESGCKDVKGDQRIKWVIFLLHVIKKRGLAFQKMRHKKNDSLFF